MNGYKSMPGNVRLYVAEITKTEKIGHCNGNFFCNSKKTIKFLLQSKNRMTIIITLK